MPPALKLHFRQGSDKNPSSDKTGELLLTALPREEARDLASSLGISVVSLANQDGTIAVFDEAGSPVTFYRGIHGPEGGADSRDAFFLHKEGCFLWGLSTGWDLLVPEHARSLALAGMEVLLVLPDQRVARIFPMELMSRARAAENQIYVALFAPGEEPLLADPTGASLPLGEEQGLFEATLRRNTLLSVRKKFALRSLRKRERYQGITIL